MKKVYFGLTRFFDTSLLGIFIGIVSAALVNILTGHDITTSSITAVECLGGCIIFLIVLIRIRQKIDDNHSKRQQFQVTSSEKWKDAVDYKNWKRIILFSFSLCSFLVLLGTGINYMIKSNRQLQENSLKSEISLNTQTILRDRIAILSNDLILNHKIIKNLDDSINKLQVNRSNKSNK